MRILILIMLVSSCAPRFEYCEQECFKFKNELWCKKEVCEDKYTKKTVHDLGGDEND